MLTVAELEAIKFDATAPNKKHTDGDGLYIKVTKGGRKTFYYESKIKDGGKRTTITLGRYPSMSLKQARKALHETKEQIKAGTYRTAKEQEASHIPTFKELAQEWYSNQNYAASTQNNVSNYLASLYEHLGSTPVDKIKPALMLQVAQIYEAKGNHEKARRMVNTATRVLSYSVVKGFQESNPLLGGIVSSQLKGKKTKHHAGIVEASEFGTLLSTISNYTGQFVTRYALLIQAHIFARPNSELLMMKWSDVDFKANQWRFYTPKMHKHHITPLSKQVIAMLKELKTISRKSEYVFYSESKPTQPISNSTMNSALRRMGYTKEKQVAHGFRASARTLIRQHLKYPVEVIELQLGHDIATNDANGGAYNRVDLIDERTEMMQKWSDYLEQLMS